MESLRLAPLNSVPFFDPCSRCRQDQNRWDRIAGKVYCPNCQESLAIGEGEPLIERAEKKVCAICDQRGTVCFLTFPLQSATAVEIDLCPQHLRSLLARSLNIHAFHQLRRRLTGLNLAVEDIFLLHGAFYDDQGQALQPAVELA